MIGGGDSKSFVDGGPDDGTLYDSRIIPKCLRRFTVWWQIISTDCQDLSK